MNDCDYCICKPADCENETLFTWRNRNLGQQRGNNRQVTASCVDVVYKNKRVQIETVPFSV
jgi:hypothetical protein